MQLCKAAMGCLKRTWAFKTVILHFISEMISLGKSFQTLERGVKSCPLGLAIYSTL